MASDVKVAQQLKITNRGDDEPVSTRIIMSFGEWPREHLKSLDFQHLPGVSNAWWDGQELCFFATSLGARLELGRKVAVAIGERLGRPFSLDDRALGGVEDWSWEPE